MIVKLEQLNIVYYIEGTFLGIYLSVDDIILLAPSVYSFITTTNIVICEAELAKF